MPNPSDWFDGAIIGVFLTGVLAVGRYLLELWKARRGEQREDRREPLTAANAAVDITEKLNRLADQAVERATADMTRMSADLENARRDLTHARTELAEARKTTGLMQGALIEVHDWIAEGATPPPPARPAWLPTRP